MADEDPQDTEADELLEESQNGNGERELTAEEKAEYKAAEQKARDKAAYDLHMGFVTQAFAADPLRQVLARVPRVAEPPAAPSPIAAATAHDPNYVSRLPRPRPKSIRPDGTPAHAEETPARRRLPTARDD